MLPSSSRRLLLQRPRLPPPQLLRPTNTPQLRFRRTPVLVASIGPVPPTANTIHRRWATFVPAKAPPAGLSPQEANALLEMAVDTWKPPPVCPGCGAPSQKLDSKLPGYYSPEKARKRLVYAAANIRVVTESRRKEDRIWNEALQRNKTEISPKKRSKRVQLAAERARRVAHANRHVTRNEVWYRLDHPEDEKSELAPTEKDGESAGVLKPDVDFQTITSTEGETAEIQEADARADLLEASSEELPPRLRVSTHCERCHELKYHNTAPPLPSYPTADTIVSLLYSSRHKYHHIYHLVDAADFPLSLDPQLRGHIERRLPKKIARHLAWTYIITRCDLLFPKQHMVEQRTGWLRKIVGEALPQGMLQKEDIVLPISSRMGWNVGKVKKMVAKSRGAIWFVGGFNVGKSSLLRDVWPKGGEMLTGALPLDDAERFGILPDEDFATDNPLETKESESDIEDDEQEDFLKTDAQKLEEILAASPSASKLPPTPEPDEEKEGFRVPPTVSRVPGTTAAPIRVSFPQSGPPGILSRHSNARAEIVDLPGMYRWPSTEAGLLKYVRRDQRKLVPMRDRVKAEQYIIKPGQSMLLGGLYMLTPHHFPGGAVILANPFTNLPVHVCATYKAVSYLASDYPQMALHAEDKQPFLQRRPEELADIKLEPSSALPPPPEANIDTSMLPAYFRHAGTVTIEQNVTSIRDPRLHPDEVKNSPYQIFGTDIVLEGVGWVELSLQARLSNTYEFPQVSVISPEGKGVAQRPTLAAWMVLALGAKEVGKESTRGRPRAPKKGHKKQLAKKKPRIRHL